MKRGLIVFEWLLLITALLIFAITESYQNFVLIGWPFLIASFILRWIRTGHIIPRTGLELPIILLVLSAGIATWAAYDQPLAFLKLSRIIGAAVLYYAIVESIYDPDKMTLNYWPPRLIAAGFVLASGLLSVYWPAQHDFNLEPVKFAIMNKVGLLINKAVPILPGPTIHSNTGGGLLALAVPFGAVLAYEFWVLRKRFLSFATILFTIVILAGLLLTGSRGAWLGLAAATGWAGLAWIQHRWFYQRNAMALFWISVLVVSIGAVVALIATGNINSVLGKLPDPSGSLIDRPRVWANGLPLFQDYFFTGIGLMAFYWQYAVYAIQSPVGILLHIHNLPLEILIEQGILGALGAAWAVLVIAGWSFRALAWKDPSIEKGLLLKNHSYLGWAGFAGVIVILIHGMVDVVFYVERTLPLMALPAGFAIFAVPVIARSTLSAREKFYRVGLPGILAACLLMACLFFFHSRIISAYYANLGAISQARAELPVYSSRPFQEATIDKVRQSLDLRQAEENFNRSLEWNPKNLTALQRLATIAMSAQNYKQALDYMQIAWDDGHRDQNTRLLYGDALVANGQVERAADVMTDITSVENHLLYQSWYRYTIASDLPRAVDALKTVLLINPNNQQAMNGLNDPLYYPITRP